MTQRRKHDRRSFGQWIEDIISEIVEGLFRVFD